MPTDFHYSLASIASYAGPCIEKTETTACFLAKPGMLIRHENDIAVSWADKQSGRGGGLESLSRKLGAPMPPAGPPASYYGGKRGGR